jgi:hypothetical protein
MNTLFEPSLLFISEAGWYDEEKQDEFLEHLINHLELIDEYDMCKIWWTDELQTILVGNPNMHPWFQSDLRNSLIVTIHQKFYNRLDYFSEFETVCNVSPNLKITYTNQDAHNHFLKLVHTLIDFKEPSYLCVGTQNSLNTDENYAFDCKNLPCYTNKKTEHTYELIPILINKANNWLSHIDVVSKFFPITIEEFDAKFEDGLMLVRKTMFNGKPYLFSFEFTPKFKKSIINRTTFQESIFIAIVKKLISTGLESKNSDLEDEFITNKRKKIAEWRMRATQRPSSTRIHYIVDKDNKITFLCYYGEGEHDDRL